MPRIASPKIEYRPRKQVWVVTLRGKVIDECRLREGCEAFVRGYLDAARNRKIMPHYVAPTPEPAAPVVSKYPYEDFRNSG